MQTQTPTVAEILQSIGFLSPPNPATSSAAAKLLLESKYQDLEISRWECQLEVNAPEMHTYSLHEEVLAEAALALDLSEEHRANMVLARCPQ